MNIAVITWMFPSTSETFVIDHIVSLINQGHNVKIFAFNKEEGCTIHSQIKEYNLLDKTHYVITPSSRKERLTRGLKIILKYILIKPLIIIKCMNFFKYGRDSINLSILFKVSPFLDKEFDIIHCHFATIGKEFLVLKDMFDVKFVTTIHGDDKTIVSCNKEALALKKLFIEADLLLPMSEYWKDKMIGMGCDPQKIKVHHMGVKVNCVVERHYKQTNGVNLLTVARLSEKKGIEYSIKSVAKIIKKYPDIIYKIIGDGPLRNRLQALISELKVGNNIILLGTKNSLEIQKELSAADIFILVSITDSLGNQEGIPVSLMEAQAVGLPVISTLHSGIPELVIDNKSGFLVQEKDIDTLSDKLCLLIEHPVIREKLGVFGCNYVYQNFNAEKLALQLNEIYKELLWRKNR